MDECMDEFDVYKVETISDSYLVASGLPKRNGDRHAVEIAKMALKLNEASGDIPRPDKKRENIQIKAGIHTGNSTIMLGKTADGNKERRMNQNVLTCSRKLRRYRGGHRGLQDA